MDRDGIILYYNGALSHDLVVEFAQIVRHKLELDKVKATTLLKVFSIVVELLQNIMRYSQDIISPDGSGGAGKEMRRGVVVVGQDGKRFFVISGNRITNDRIELLSAKLSPLQEMDRRELKRFCAAQRRENSPEESLGAGLGFIEIAKNASEPILFEFIPVSESESFFIVKSVV